MLAATLFCTAIAMAAKTPAQKLMKRLTKIQKSGVMYGHQDDPFYGLTWEYVPGRSDTKDLTGYTLPSWASISAVLRWATARISTAFRLTSFTTRQ